MGVKLVQEDAELARLEAKPQVDPVLGPPIHRPIIAWDLHTQSHDHHVNSSTTTIQGANQSVVDVDPSPEAQLATWDLINPERDDLLI